MPTLTLSGRGGATGGDGKLGHPLRPGVIRLERGDLFLEQRRLRVRA